MVTSRTIQRLCTFQLVDLSLQSATMGHPLVDHPSKWVSKKTALPPKTLLLHPHGFQPILKLFASQNQPSIGNRFELIAFKCDTIVARLTHCDNLLFLSILRPLSSLPLLFLLQAVLLHQYHKNNGNGEEKCL